MIGKLLNAIDGLKTKIGGVVTLVGCAMYLIPPLQDSADKVVGIGVLLSGAGAAHKVQKRRQKAKRGES